VIPDGPWQQEDLTGTLQWVVDTVNAGEAEGRDRRVLAHQLARGMKRAE
jgi:hypothetical protein